MPDGTKDRVEGMVDEAKGNAKSAWGEATGDKRTHAEGEMEKMTGKVKQGLGDLKDAVAGAADRVKDEVAEHAPR